MELESAVETVDAAFRSFSAMSDFAGRETPSRERIFTQHGTFLAYDLETGKIVHVAREFSFLYRRFLPLSLSVGEKGACLLTESGDYVVNINGNGKAQIVAVRPETGSVFEIIRSADKNPNLFSLKLLGLFVCAEEDGRITVSRKVAAKWETLSTASINS
jgi:hypothetical protein